MKYPYAKPLVALLRSIPMRNFVSKGIEVLLDAYEAFGDWSDRGSRDESQLSCVEHHPLFEDEEAAEEETDSHLVR